jgi:hypothetical protein
MEDWSKRRKEYKVDGQKTRMMMDETAEKQVFIQVQFKYFRVVLY